MAIANDYTLMSLDRWARVMGVNPLHFNGALTPGLNPQVFPDRGCNSVWYQFDWQKSDQVSRDQLAMTIKGAEDDVTQVIGFPPAPMWVESEIAAYPKHAMIGSRSIMDETLDVDGRPKGINAQYGKFITAGQRAVTLVGAATTAGGELVYTDDDGDGFYETATITLPLPAELTSITDACSFSAFFDGESDPEWQIRYPRSATIIGGNIVLVYDSWLFIDPDLWNAYPTSDGASAIDVSDVANFVTTVDVYYEYADHTQPSAVLYWENGQSYGCQVCGGVGCEVCQYTAQDGCIIARDANLGILVPTPATYDEDNETWTRTSYSLSCRPDMVKMWYLAGDQDKRYIQGKTCDPLSHFWAQIIAWIATARLERPLCTCGNLTAISEWLKVDLSTFGRAEATHYQTDDIINNPFGTMRGEVLAWRRIKKAFKSKRLSVAVI
jgi:hypothetical protein